MANIITNVCHWFENGFLKDKQQMSYTPYTWSDGEIITPQKFNNIENGIASVSRTYTPFVWEDGNKISINRLNTIEEGIHEVLSSYTPYVWKNNDAITATRLNAIEQGVSRIPAPTAKAITDDVDTMVAKIKNGTVRYFVGDWITITTSQGTYNLQIVGKNKDTLTSGGTADYTFLCEQIVTTHKMNETSPVNGYVSSSLRGWLINTVLPTLPTSIQNNIKPVDKVTRNIINYQAIDGISSETIWIPSAREVAKFGEGTGCTYDDIFTSNISSRIKRNLNGTAATWWLRTSDSSSGFYAPNIYGNIYSWNITNELGVAFGFCLSHDEV